jgi:hypothetical protein
MVEILRFAQDDNPPVILSATKDLKITFTAKKTKCARGEG